MILNSNMLSGMGKAMITTGYCTPDTFCVCVINTKFNTRLWCWESNAEHLLGERSLIGTHIRVQSQYIPILGESLKKILWHTVAAIYKLVTGHTGHTGHIIVFS